MVVLPARASASADNCQNTPAMTANVKVPEKYTPAILPETAVELNAAAGMRELWAKEARERDQPGSAREFELTALALRALAARKE